MALGKKSGLGSKGKGISALINSEVDNMEASLGSVIEIDINKIEPNKNQPRKRFEESALEALAESIRECGVVQPILVKKDGEFFQLIAGERRWRASKIAGLKKIPAIVKDYDEQKLYQVSLIENLQREDLNPIEEANGYKRLNNEFGLSQDEIAKKVSKSRSAVSNSMRLLNLDERVQTFVVECKISGGHARTLLSVEDGNIQFELSEKIIEEQLSVRQVEALVKHLGEEKKEVEEKESKLNTSTFNKIEDDLKSLFGTKVKLKGKQNKGKIEIEFYSDEDLDRLICLMNKINI